MPEPLRGHAVLPHTADVVIEAWGPGPADCYEEAVAALVAVFAETGGVGGEPVQGGPVPLPVLFEVGPAAPEDLVVLLLEEVLARLDAAGEVPVSSRVEVRGDVLAGALLVVPAGAVEVVGPVPKGISYEGLDFSRSGGTWRCRATVDV